MRNSFYIARQKLMTFFDNVFKAAFITPCIIVYYISDILAPPLIEDGGLPTQEL